MSYLENHIKKQELLFKKLKSEKVVIYENTLGPHRKYEIVAANIILRPLPLFTMVSLEGIGASDKPFVDSFFFFDPQTEIEYLPNQFLNITNGITTITCNI